VLVGLVTAIGRSQICELLRSIIGQGWTSIRIKIVNVRQVGGVILIASEYAAIGSGENAGRDLNCDVEPRFGRKQRRMARDAAYGEMSFGSLGKQRRCSGVRAGIGVARAREITAREAAGEEKLGVG
jgi:hypothetical protein